MTIEELIGPEQVMVIPRATDKAALLRDLAVRAAPLVGLAPEAVLEALLAREKLGSTGLGKGFALPHARLANLDHFFGLFARLTKPVEFLAIDEQPVDLVFLLLIPAAAGNEHVAALAAISRHFREAEFAARLRKGKTPAELYEVIAKSCVGSQKE